MSSLYGGYGTSTGNPSRSGATGNKIPKGYQKGQLQQFTPEQMQLFQQLLGNLGPDNFLTQLAGGGEGAFEQMEAPALRQFGEIQGGLASRFSGMGTGGRKSSGFQNTMNQAASDFAQQLQANRQGIQRQALLDLMGIGTSLLGQKPYEQFLTKKPNFLEKLFGAGAGALTGGISGYAAGGWPGAAIGASGGGLSGYQGG